MQKLSPGLNKPQLVICKNISWAHFQQSKPHYFAIRPYQLGLQDAFYQVFISCWFVIVYQCVQRVIQCHNLDDVLSQWLGTSNEWLSVDRSKLITVYPIRWWWRRSSTSWGMRALPNQDGGIDIVEDNIKSRFLTYKGPDKMLAFLRTNFSSGFSSIRKW